MLVAWGGFCNKSYQFPGVTVFCPLKLLKEQDSVVSVWDEFQDKLRSTPVICPKIPNI
jgi:hypothetical protein